MESGLSLLASRREIGVQAAIISIVSMTMTSAVAALFGFAVGVPVAVISALGPPIWLVVRHRIAAAKGEAPSLWGTPLKMVLCAFATFVYLGLMAELLAFTPSILMLIATSLWVTLAVYCYERGRVLA